jgi:hypothetical protein
MQSKLQESRCFPPDCKQKRNAKLVRSVALYARVHAQKNTLPDLVIRNAYVEYSAAQLWKKLSPVGQPDKREKKLGKPES